MVQSRITFPVPSIFWVSPIGEATATESKDRREYGLKAFQTINFSSESRGTTVQQEKSLFPDQLELLAILQTQVSADAT